MAKLIQIEDAETGAAIYVNTDNLTVVFQNMRTDKDGNVTDQLVTVLAMLNGNILTPERIEDVIGKIKAQQ